MLSNSSVLTGIRWAFNVREWKPTAEEWNLAVRCVQNEEKQRIHRFVYQDDAKSAMIGRLLMRKAANVTTGIPYDKIRFLRTEHGKPYISSYSNFLKELNYSFNVSHNGSYCVIAAEPYNCALGVDVMEIAYRGSTALSDYFNLMKKQFSSSEFEFLTTPLSEKHQLERFFRLWCLKESYVKATGTGISSSLKDLDFSCHSSALVPHTVTTDTFLSLDGAIATEWLFEETLIGSSHCVAVAIKQDSDFIQERHMPLEFSEISYNSLMENAIPFEPADQNAWSDFSEKPAKSA